MSKKRLNLYLLLNALISGILIVSCSFLLRSLELLVTVSVIGGIILVYLSLNVLLFVKFFRKNGLKHGKSIR